MGILRVKGLSKSFGIVELFREVSFDVVPGDKVGFVGANGAGKSTLMRCLLGLEPYDAGSVGLDDAETIGYVEQEAAFDGTLEEELRRSFADVVAWQAEMADLERRIEAERDEAALAQLMRAYEKTTDCFERAGGYGYESQMRRVAFGLGFAQADLDRPAAQFSGGQKTRICLAKALLRAPEFLFLDEPTNHLDIAMVEWLEAFLASYRGGVLLISHDRFFLDRVANRIVELENRTLTNYAGNYTTYLRLKRERREALEGAYKKQQAHIEKTEAYIRRYKAGIKSKQARGREKQLERLERIVLPPDSVGFNYFAFHPPGECAQRVVEFEAVHVSYGARPVLDGVSLLVRRGDGIGLIGPNGAGKTTLLKVLTGELEVQQGRVKIGSKVKLAYFSQQHEGLQPQNRVIDEIAYPYDLTEEQARRYLGAFLFRGDEVFARVGSLSGGEKSRLAFLKLMLSGANFLVLDEPTNHLDIPAKEAVEEALMAFPGTFIAVSHDRYFLDKVTNRILALAQGQLRAFDGNYSDSCEQLAREKARAAQAAQLHPAERPAPDKKSSVREKKPRDQARRAAQYEAEIAMAEQELKVLAHRLNDPATHADAQQSREMSEAYAAKEMELAQLYDLWAGCE